jgi:hypothetical protein
MGAQRGGSKTGARIFGYRRTDSGRLYSNASFA